jgi:hypothetical protein
MARFATCLLSVMLAASFCLGQSANTAPASPPPAQDSSSMTSSAKPHGPLPVELTKSLDSKKLKEGDVVTGRVLADVHAADGTQIPHGSKLTGHVTEARARSKGDASSSLGIIFDKITLPDGKELAIKGQIQAVAPNPNSGTPEAVPGGSIGPGMMAGHEAGGTGTTPPPQPNMPASQGSGRPVLTAQSKGIVGIHNLELGQNSVLNSGGKDVRLDSGTQMIVSVEFE